MPFKKPAKKLVEVAEVEVELAAMKEPVLSILKSSEPAELVKERNLPVKEGVEEALIKVPVVPVAFTWKRAVKSSEAVVVAPTTKDFREEEVAERKSPLTESSKVLPKPAPVLKSVPQPNKPEVQVNLPEVESQVARLAPLKEAVKRLEEEAVVEKKLVVVAEVVVELPVTKRSLPRVTNPLLPMILRAEVVVVASPATVVVAKYRLPPAFRNVH